MGEEKMRGDFLDTVVRIIHGGMVLPANGQSATIYVSPIDAVAPLNLPAARRLLFARALERMLRGSGYDTQCRSVFADEDSRVHTLVVSIWLRYLELCGEAAPYLQGCYQGDYIFDFAATLHRNHAERWRVEADKVAQLVTQPGTTPERLYHQLQHWLGDEALTTITGIGLQSLAEDIHNDLRELGLSWEHWPQISDLIRQPQVNQLIAQLSEQGIVRSKGTTVYLQVSGLPEVVLQSDSLPTPLTARLVDIGSVLDSDEKNDLFIYVYDIDDGLFSQCLSECAQRLWKTRLRKATVTLKPLVAGLQVLEVGETLSSSPLVEDFVSFREARHALGLRYLLDRFAATTGDVSMTIDLAEAANGTVAEYSPMFPTSTSELIDREILHNALQGLGTECQRDAETVLHAISEFPGIHQQALHCLEPAQLTGYYRKLCEKCLSYYNKHQIMVASKKSPHGQAQKTVLSAMDAALRRVADVIE